VILSLLRGDHVPLTAGEQAKDYSYVEDIVRAFVLAGSRPQDSAGRIFNIGSGTTVSMRDLVETIATHFDGADDLLGWGEVPYRDNEMWFQGTSIDAARSALGWEPEYDLESGIAETVAWYRENQGLYER
jgi:nucleoside-diphosphate-sugar epimerase